MMEEPKWLAEAYRAWRSMWGAIPTGEYLTGKDQQKICGEGAREEGRHRGNLGPRALGEDMRCGRCQGSGRVPLSSTSRGRELVELLRLFGNSKTIEGATPQMPELLLEAADEIERLRAVAEEARAMLYLIYEKHPEAGGALVVHDKLVGVLGREER